MPLILRRREMIYTTDRGMLSCKDSRREEGCSPEKSEKEEPKHKRVGDIPQSQMLGRNGRSHVRFLDIRRVINMPLLRLKPVKSVVRRFMRCLAVSRGWRWRGWTEECGCQQPRLGTNPFSDSVCGGRSSRSLKHGG